MHYVRWGEGNLGRMKDGETIRWRITCQAFILSSTPSNMHPVLHHPSPPPHTHTHFSDQIKLKPDGAGPGLCVVSDCHGALTMISHWDDLPGQKKSGGGGVGKDREKEEMIGEREFSERRRAGQRGDWWIRFCCQQINPTDRTVGTGWYECYMTWRQACNRETQGGSIPLQIGFNINLNPNPIMISLTSAYHSESKASFSLAHQWLSVGDCLWHIRGPEDFLSNTVTADIKPNLANTGAYEFL